MRIEGSEVRRISDARRIRNSGEFRYSLPKGIPCGISRCVQRIPFASKLISVYKYK
jgi:hypothetical protein